jgi:hypothetical protein
MSITDTEESLHETQEEGSVPSTMDVVPTMDAVPTMEAVPIEDDISQPSLVILDMKVMHMDVLIDSAPVIAHSESATPADGSSAAGFSNRTRGSWISAALTSGSLSFFTAVATYTRCTESRSFLIS